MVSWAGVEFIVEDSGVGGRKVISSSAFWRREAALEPKRLLRPRLDSSVADVSTLPSFVIDCTAKEQVLTTPPMQAIVKKTKLTSPRIKQTRLPMISSREQHADIRRKGEF